MKLLPKSPANETDIEVSNFLTKHIANFAQTGNPTPNNDEEDDISSFVWPLFKSCENDIVMIEKDGNVVVKKDKDVEQNNSWKSFFQQISFKTTNSPIEILYHKNAESRDSTCCC